MYREDIVEGDEGTFLTSLKGSKSRANLKDPKELLKEEERKAMVLFGLHDPEGNKQKLVRKSSFSSKSDIQFKELKKPPIYLPELRDRKDVWKGKSSGDLLALNKSSKKTKKTIDPIGQLRSSKNWFLIPQKNVFLCLSDKDLNDELKKLSSNCKPPSVQKPELPPSMSEEKWQKKKYKNRYRMGEAMSHLKDVKKN